MYENVSIASLNELFCGDVAVHVVGNSTGNALGQYNDGVNGNNMLGYVVKQEATGLIEGNCRFIGGNITYYPHWPYYDYDCTKWQWGYSWPCSNQYFDYSWRVDVTKQDRITLSVDVPGVLLSDISVDVDAYNIRVTGKRSDTGANVSHMYTLPQCYDTKSIAAKLNNGVLTITVKKLKDMCSRKITVKEG